MVKVEGNDMKYVCQEGSTEIKRNFLGWLLGQL